MKTSRPGVLTIAAILLGLISLLSLATPLLAGPPLPVKVLAVVTGLIGLLAAYGLWQAKRWGMIVAIIVSALNALSAAPGLLAMPTLRKEKTMADRIEVARPMVQEATVAAGGQAPGSRVPRDVRTL